MEVRSRGRGDSDWLQRFAALDPLVPPSREPLHSRLQRRNELRFDLFITCLIFIAVIIGAIFQFSAFAEYKADVFHSTQTLPAFPPTPTSVFNVTVCASVSANVTTKIAWNYTGTLCEDVIGDVEPDYVTETSIFDTGIYTKLVCINVTLCSQGYRSDNINANDDRGVSIHFIDPVSYVNAAILPPGKSIPFLGPGVNPTNVSETIYLYSYDTEENTHQDFVDISFLDRIGINPGDTSRYYYLSSLHSTYFEKSFLYIRPAPLYSQDITHVANNRPHILTILGSLGGFAASVYSGARMLRYLLVPNPTTPAAEPLLRYT